MGRFANFKGNLRQGPCTIPPTPDDLVLEFRRQEAIRVSKPTEPFEYQLGERTICVGPLVRVLVKNLP